MLKIHLASFDHKHDSQLYCDRVKKAEMHSKWDEKDSEIVVTGDEDCPCDYHRKKHGAFSIKTESWRKLPPLPESYPETLEGYSNKFGKQFRRSSEQVESGISLEDAYKAHCEVQPEYIQYKSVKNEREEIRKQAEKTYPATPDAYRKKFGKRFKMKKDQVERGLSRQEAYEEFKNIMENNTENLGVSVGSAQDNTSAPSTAESIETRRAVINPTTPIPANMPQTIDAYTAKYGMRFRMLAEQKQRGLSREAAFAEGKWIERIAS